MSSLVDSHCHIPMIEGESSVADIINEALQNDVGHMLCVSVELSSFPEILSLARQYPRVSASVERSTVPNIRSTKQTKNLISIVLTNGLLKSSRVHHISIS